MSLVKQRLFRLRTSSLSVLVAQNDERLENRTQTSMFCVDVIGQTQLAMHNGHA